jgi:hypothetical protein
VWHAGASHANSRTPGTAWPLRHNRDLPRPRPTRKAL